MQADPGAAALLNSTYGLQPRQPFAALEKTYKYLIVVGGNAEFTASRSVAALSSELTPLWAFTEHTEFFAPLLQPYRHYVPLSKEWDELYSKIEWARRNEALAEGIARAGRDFAAAHFHTGFVNAYLYALLSEYAKLQRFEPALTPRHLQVVVRGEAALAELRQQAGGCPLWRGD